MSTPQERQKALIDISNERVLVLDGAMGTMIQQAPLSIETDYLGRENCPEILNVTRPDVIHDIHREYLEAGADIVETNTFGGTPIVLAEYELDDRAYELNFAAAQAGARRRPTSSPPPRSRASSPARWGPPTKISPSPAPRLSPNFAPTTTSRPKAWSRAAPTILLIETCFDTRNVKAGLLAVEQLRARAGHRDSGDGFRDHRAHGHDAGRPAGRRVVRLDRAPRSARRRPELRHRSGVHDGPHPHAQRDGVARASPAIRTPACRTRTASICETPESLAAQLERFVEHGWLNIVGGCCGTTPAHIRAIAQMVEGKQAAAHARRRSIAPTIPASSWWRPRRATAR